MTATLPSLANLKSNPAWASLPLFDRTGWKRMAFGEFAESVRERAEPRDAQEEIDVGLEHLDPKCLHLLMMSDRLMNRAVEITVGSLSPTINWTTLRLETFNLPPLGQQRRKTRSSILPLSPP